MTNHYSSRSRGFMLVMVLVLLVIVGTAAAAMARRSMIRSTQALQAEQDLLRVWGMKSARHVLSGTAEQLIDAASMRQDHPVQSVYFHITLNQMPLQILLSDEQAKPNVHTLYEQSGITAAQELMTSWMRENPTSAMTGMTVRLRPLERSTLALAGQGAAGRPWPRFAGYSAVFDKQDLASIWGFQKPPANTELMGASFSHPAANAPGTLITCWGDGRLRWSHASENAIAAISDSLIGLHATQALIRMRHEQPGISSHQAVNQLNLQHEVRDQLVRKLTDHSRCHAIIVSVLQGGRRHTSMRVEETLSDGKQTHHFYEQSWP